MSLNGLDDPKIKEAHEAAVADAGGWYVDLATPRQPARPAQVARLVTGMRLAMVSTGAPCAANTEIHVEGVLHRSVANLGRVPHFIGSYSSTPAAMRSRSWRGGVVWPTCEPASSNTKRHRRCSAS